MSTVRGFVHEFGETDTELRRTGPLTSLVLTHTPLDWEEEDLFGAERLHA